MRSKFGNAVFVQWDAISRLHWGRLRRKRKKTPNFKRKPSISTVWRQHLGLIALTSTHDWWHASVVISEDKSIVTSFKAQLGSFCIRVGSFSLYTCGISLYRCRIVLPVYMWDRPPCIHVGLRSSCIHPPIVSFCIDEGSFTLYTCRISLCIDVGSLSV